LSMKQDFLSVLDGLLEELELVERKLNWVVDTLVELPQYSRFSDRLYEAYDFLGEVLFPLIIEHYDKYVEGDLYAVTVDDYLEVFDRMEQFERLLRDYAEKLDDLEPVGEAVDAYGQLYTAKRMVTEAIVDYLHEWRRLIDKARW